MPDPINSFVTDPAALTPAERTRAIAAILAVGLCRRPILCPDPPALSRLQKVSETSPNELASAAEQSVTVSVG